MGPALSVPVPDMAALGGANDYGQGLYAPSGIAQDVPVHAIDANDPAQATALARELTADLVVSARRRP